MAAQTTTIRLGAGVSVLPFHHPLRLAEEAAMGDVLSDGRLNFGVGRGSATYEYGNCQIDFDSRATRFHEALASILGRWTTEDFPYHGHSYQVDGLPIAPRPVQQPHLPVPLAVSRTAATGTSSRLADMPFFRFVSLSQDAKDVVGYPQEAIPWGRDLRTSRRTSTQGDESNVHRAYWKTVRPAAPPSEESALVTNLSCCTPDRCVERLAALQSQHGIAYFGAAFSFGTLAHAKVMASMQLCAEQVRPTCR